MVNLEMLLANLFTVPRWGIVHTLRQQSVAEHSYGVMWILQWLETDIPDDFACLSVEETLETYKYALRHDAGEGLSGDIPSVAKGVVNDGTVAHLEVRHNVAIEPNIECPGAKELSKWLVKIADYLEALLFLNHEIMCGNRWAEAVSAAVLKNFEGHMGQKSGRDMLQRLMAHIEHMQPPGLSL